MAWWTQRDGDDSCLVGLYDPVNGAGSLMEGTLERPIEVPAALVRDNMQEASEADSGRSSTRPRTATGSAGPSRGMRKTRQRAARRGCPARMRAKTSIGHNALLRLPKRTPDAAES